MINFINALLITEVVEAAMAFVMGYRGKRFNTALLLINLITNPLLNYTIYIMFFFGILKYRFPAVIILEAAVVIGEWKLFEYVFSENNRSYLLLSLLINSSSLLAGIIILG